MSEKAQSARNLPRSWATRIPSGPRPPGPRAPSSQRGAGELDPAFNSPAAVPETLLQAQWRIHSGSGFSKHTFVSTHATGARAHAPRARAQPSWLQTARPGRSAAAGGCERSQCALRSAARLGAGCGTAESRGVSGRAPRSLTPWRPGGTRMAHPPWDRQPVGSRRTKASGECCSLAQGRWRRRSEYRAEPGTLRTLFFALRRVWSNLGPSHGPN